MISASSFIIHLPYKVFFEDSKQITNDSWHKTSPKGKEQERDTVSWKPNKGKNKQTSSHVISM